MMSDIYKVIRIVLFLYLTANFQNAYAQAGVLNPNDPIVVYNPSAPPATPAAVAAACPRKEPHGEGCAGFPTGIRPVGLAGMG